MITFCVTITCLFLFATFHTDVNRWSISSENSIEVTTADPWVLLDGDVSQLTTEAAPNPRVLGKVSKRPANQSDASSIQRKPYPKRENMGECPALYGKVTVFVAFAASSYKTWVLYFLFITKHYHRKHNIQKT